ncbi:MAG: IPT/TIG domain-containing protein [Acidobacteriota bacterium]
MKLNRRFAILTACLIVASLALAHGSINRAKLGQTRSIALPPDAILDERTEPVIASSGKTGFVSSVTAGAIVAFSLTSGRVISTMVVGETAGPLTMTEVEGRRLLAVPSANNPAAGHPATVSIIDATRAKRMELRALIALPPSVQITTATRALLTDDGRFCLIASSFEEPALYVFDVATGEAVSQLSLAGRPSEIALYESDATRKVAVASAVSNSLSLIRLDEEGGLSLAGNFSPTDARFDEWNNPAFSRDGREVYIAALTGDQLFCVNAESGALVASVEVDAPQRVSVSRDAKGTDIAGVTRIRRPTSYRQGGATIVEKQGRRLSVRAQFTTPDGIDFTRANNLVFDKLGEVAFIGSASGMLFAFNTESGELDSFQSLGGSLGGVGLTEKGRALAVVRSSSSSDEVVIVGFDLTSDEGEPAPVITRLDPDRVEQGRLKNLRLRVFGENFTEGASLIVNDVETAAQLLKNGRTLETRLPKSLFDNERIIQIRVKGANGAVSNPQPLNVVRPEEPIIDRIKPRDHPGPSEPFTLKVTGKNFRASSVIIVDDQRLNTQRVSNRELRAQVSAETAQRLGLHTVRVGDLLVTDLLSNESVFELFGPRITELIPSVKDVVAGQGGFKLRIVGENFRPGAKVRINGVLMTSSNIIRRSGTSIRLNVPRRLVERAGKLSVVVRNKEGGESEPKELDLFAPEIRAFVPGKVLAGQEDVKVVISGAHFRKKARVAVAAGEGAATRIEKRRVKFRSRTRIVVTLAGELNDLLSQPGVLKFQVINPNKSEGVPSEPSSLEVAGPEISEALIVPVAEDETQVKIVIKGANFRAGARVFFIKDEAIVRREDAERVRDDKVVVTLKAKKLEALGDFRLQVVNPGNVRSNAERPRPGERADDEEVKK